MRKPWWLLFWGHMVVYGGFMLVMFLACKKDQPGPPPPDPDWPVIGLWAAIYATGAVLTACGLAFYGARRQQSWQDTFTSDRGRVPGLLMVFGYPIALPIIGVYWLLRLFWWLGTPGPPKEVRVPVKCADCKQRMEEPKPAEGAYRS